MIDPVIFSFKFFNLVVTLRWYGVLVMFGALVGAWITEKEVTRRGENGEVIWDALVWVLPIGILGARTWYIINNIISGSRYYLDEPVRMLYITEGGLHIFGGFVFGAVTLYYFLKSKGMDFWLFLDAIAPAALIGQALARPANFINQELYGPPTSLPWGIRINDFQSRLPQYQDLAQYPLESARFHPTFAYEMILNILAGLILLWVARRYREQLKPGAIFAGWLVSAGFIRSFIEFFRPDQPHLGGSFLTTSMLIAFLMGVSGVIALLIRNGIWQPAFAASWKDDYFFAQKEKPARAARRSKSAQEEPAPEIKPAGKKKTSTRKTSAKKK